MAHDKTDIRLEEIQQEVDEIRRRLPHEPGFDIQDPDAKTLYPGEDADETTLGDV